MSKQPSIEDFFVSICERENKTTVLLPTPRGGFVVYVHADEVTPFETVMHAAIDIMRRMGKTSHGVKISPLAVSIDPKTAYYWEVFHPQTGKREAHGYGKSDEDCRNQIAEYMKSQCLTNGGSNDTKH